MCARWVEQGNVPAKEWLEILRRPWPEIRAILLDDSEESRRLHSMLRDQRVVAGIGRAWANEILHHARLSPYALVPLPGRRVMARSRPIVRMIGVPMVR